MANKLVANGAVASVAAELMRRRVDFIALTGPDNANRRRADIDRWRGYSPGHAMIGPVAKLRNHVPGFAG